MTDETSSSGTPIIIPGSAASNESRALFERAVAEEMSATVFSVRQTARARELLARFSGARRSVTFYPRGHVVVKDNLTALMAAIKQYHDDAVDIPLVFFDNEVLLGEQLLAQESMIFDQLIRDMTESGMTSVTFLQGLDMDELERAMQVLALDGNAVEQQFGGLEAAVASVSIPHVQIGTVAFARDVGDFENPEAANNRSAYVHAIDAVRVFGQRTASDQPVSVYQVRDAARSIVDNVLGNKSAMLELSGLKSHDEYTFFHSVNVTILSVALGSLISSNRRFLNSLGVGALLHDIGKMSVDLDIINKRGPLSAAEWDVMRLHPVHGAEAAAAMRGLDRSSIVVILEHHMRYDLDGYPARMPRRPQHLTSRIVALCDAYDAMTSRRSYAEARPQDEAMEILAKNAGTAFDPALVRMFTQMMGIYPPRSVVRLSSGEIAIVIVPNTDIVAPSIRVITDEAGAFIEPYDVDLSDAAAAAGRRIEQCLDASALNIDIDDYLLPH
jgi:HD-GYP domain-containing protein (c-di-GMP phosphodiesterase class II)